MFYRIFTSNCRILAIIGLLLVGVSEAGTVYRFKDKNGETVVDSVLPPAYAQHGYDVLDDKSLRVIEHVPPKRSEAQILADQDSERSALEQAQLNRKRQKRDRNLLATYLTLEDVKLAKAGRLHSIKNSISFSQKAIVSLEQKLDGLITSASVYELDGNTVPHKLLTEIDQAKEEIDRNNRLIQTYREQLDATETQFDSDIERFSELKKRQQPAPN